MADRMKQEFNEMQKMLNEFHCIRIVLHLIDIYWHK